MTISRFRVENKPTKTRAISDTLVSLFAFLLIIVLLTNPAKYASKILEGLLLFATAVLPGLFPFMFLTKILTNLGCVQKLAKKCGRLTKVLFNSPGIGAYTLIMSMLSGYPIGAKIIGDLHSNNLISDADAKKMITFSMTSGPAFVIGSVGALMFGNALVGLVILISHFVSNILTGILFCKFSKTTSQIQIQTQNLPSNTATSIDKILSDSMYSSIQSILIVGGFISVFYCFSEILIDLKIFDILSYIPSKLLEFMGAPAEIARGVMSGIVEVTRGAKELSTFFPLLPALSVSLTSALISFSGLSIIFQAKAFLSSTQIKTHFLIASKSVHAILSFLICLIISSLVF